MDNKTISIVMAADDKYSVYMGVAIASLIGHVNTVDHYEISILESEISKVHKERLLKLETENVSIRFINVSGLMAEFNIKETNHLRKEATYRLLADKVFADKKRVLYLDCDIIVNRDVAELFRLDLGDCIIGASRAKLFSKSYKYINEQLRIAVDEYFNSGVLLIDIAKFRENRIGETGLEMLSDKRYPTMDQDVLNILCQGKTMIIDGRWNVEWEHLVGCSEEPVIDDAYKDILEYDNDPFIIHYTSAYKPWAFPQIKFAEEFWRAARKTVFYEEILFQNLERATVFKHFIFPMDDNFRSANVIIYGAGMVGQAYIEQIRRTSFCRIAAVCDKRFVSWMAQDIKQITPDKLENEEFDYILIAIESEGTACEVRKELARYNIENDKIMWVPPIVRGSKI